MSSLPLSHPISLASFVAILNTITTPFPTITKRATITPKGFTSNGSGFKYCRANGTGRVVTIPINILYNAYCHFYGQTVTSIGAGTFLGTYKAYSNFWMDLMVKMKLATIVSTRPATIYM